MLLEGPQFHDVVPIFLYYDSRDLGSLKGYEDRDLGHPISYKYRDPGSLKWVLLHSDMTVTGPGLTTQYHAILYIALEPPAHQGRLLKFC